LKHKILTSIISSLFIIIAVEISLHLLVKPHENFYGLLFGKPLSPKLIIPPSSFDLYHKKVSDKHEKSIYTESGFERHEKGPVKRLDDLIGYTNKESAESEDGWFHSNNLGAKSNVYTPPEKLHGRKRILFFGDSFTEGSGLPPQETFVHLINEINPNVEALNFGVSGYSTGQAYLRFKSLKSNIEFDSVVLVFVPFANLWRDINVSRYIGEEWINWGAVMLPRFVIEGGELKLIPPPYNSIKELVEENEFSISPRLRNHLRKYEAFYYSCLYESQPFLDYFITYKLLKLKYCNHFKVKNKFDLFKPDSEAMKITKMILEDMNKEAESEGADFAVMILPVRFEIMEYKKNPNYKKLWDDMSSYICSGNYECFDLMNDFQNVPYENIDVSYDEGRHLGPATNKYIADFISNALTDYNFETNGRKE